MAVSLAALKLITDHVTAVVTVADDGGSSGRLRAEFDVLPPGDLRMALAALCEDSTWGLTWASVMQHRFGGEGPLSGHALGNLLIVALWDLLEDPVEGLDLVGTLLHARGRVLPMANEPLRIEADILGHDPAYPDVTFTVRGQHVVAATTGRVDAIRLRPPNPLSCPDSVAAVRDAEWVILGPGSWFTSVLPHVLVPELREALVTTSAKRLLNLNLDHGRGETRGFRAVDLLASLSKHAPGLTLDVVLADPSSVDDVPAVLGAAADLGAELVTMPVAAMRHSGKHDALRLAAAYRDLFG